MMALLKGDLLAASFLFLLPQHAPCLLEAFKLVSGIVRSIYGLQYLLMNLRDFAVSFLFALCSTSAGPGPAHISAAIGPTGDQDGPMSEGLRDQLGS